MIQKLKFTEIFLMVMDFYPRYMYMGKIVRCPSLYSTNLATFQDKFVEDFLEDNFHMLYSMFSYVMHNDLLFKDGKKISFGVDDVICMYDIDICLVPNSYGITLKEIKETDLWAIYCTLMPRQRLELEKKYKNLKRASLS
jgi:hypothetical protein